MGEQPVPVEDEVERALASMRAGFLSGSDQITASVAALEEHLDEVPLEQRESVRVAVTQLVGAHERLKLKMEHLPTPSWDRFKVVVSVVKAQQTVLDQLGHLVKEHVLPRQLQNLTITPFPQAPPAAADFPPAASPAADVPAAPALADFPPAPASSLDFPPAPASSLDFPPASAAPAFFYPAPASQPRPRRAEPFDDDEDEPRSMFSLVRERTAGFRGLAAMIVAGVVLSLVPRDIKLQDTVARLVEMVGAGSETAATGEAAARTELAPTPPPAAAAVSPAERTPPPADVAAATDRPGRAAKVPSDRKRAAVSSTRRSGGGDGAEPPPSVPRGGKRVAAVASEPATPPAKAAEKQFVPVVFTHKDRATAMRALSDLKKQYPNVLIGRKGEILPVNLGKKGIWHRLVLLPAASRPQAKKLCDQLMIKGYDRCWVKAY